MAFYEFIYHWVLTTGQAPSLLATNRLVNVLDSIRDRCYPNSHNIYFLSPTGKSKDREGENDERL